MLKNSLRKRPYLLILALVLLLVAAFLARDVMRDIVVRPMLLGLWQAWNMTQGFPQVLIWAIFVATVPVIAVFNLVVSGRPQEAEKPPVAPRPPGQIQTLAVWIQQASAGDYFKTRLYRHVSNITLDTLGYREQLSDKEVRARLKSGELRLDPTILTSIKQGWRQKVWQTSDREASKSSSDIDPQLTKIIEFLETELELEHDS